MELNVALSKNQAKVVNEDEVHQLREKLKRYELEMVSLIRATETVRAEAEHYLSQRRLIERFVDSKKREAPSHDGANLIEKGRLYDDKEVAELIGFAAQSFDNKIALLVDKMLQSKNFLGMKFVSETLIAKWLVEAEIFDQDYYLTTNADVQKQGSNPALHYIKHGRNEGRRPGPIFKQRLDTIN